MVYNARLLTGIELTSQEIKMLADEDVVHAVKWSHLEVSRIHDTRLLCGLNFPIFAGIDVIAFEAIAVGADGWIGGLPMMVPKLARRLHRLLVCEKDLKAARDLWYRLLRSYNWSTGPWVPTMATRTGWRFVGRPWFYGASP